MELRNIAESIFNINDVAMITSKRPNEIENLFEGEGNNASKIGDNLYFSFNDIWSYINGGYSNEYNKRVMAEVRLVFLYTEKRKKRGQ
jgi:hypothetical protein